ncbi:MAG TPA: site-specific integrase [Pirellulales bacterium]|nr:site-specific integrase [Pirellulales bacterium]
MRRRRKERRQAHGSAWHWKQTDCWYYTPAGSRRRVPLFDEHGERIRGKQNQPAAEWALDRAKLADAAQAEGKSPGGEAWLVARVCSEYIQYCDRGLAAGSISQGHCRSAAAFLNDLCRYCGALPAGELKKAHVQEWLESHAGWRSPATYRSVLAIVLAAFNRAEEMFDVPNPLKGMKKPASKPRLQSFSSEDEQAMYDATEARFRDFLFAAIRTGLRPFSELARLTADHVEETERGMMWRVYATKTKKTRKIPVPEEVAALTHQLMLTAAKDSGKPLFRNTKDKPWKGSNGVVRFIAIKRKLGWNLNPVKRNYSCYTCRHTFAHRMLSGYWNGGAGCSIETLAELIGDTPKVAFDHYGREWGQHYQEPLWAALGVGPNVASGAALKPVRGAARQKPDKHASQRKRPAAKQRSKTGKSTSASQRRQRT